MTYYYFTQAHNEKQKLRKKLERQRITRNALRGAANPYSIDKASSLFISIESHADKVLLFNEHIGNLFPLILNLVFEGYSLPKIEKTLHLTHRFLWRWLNVRRRLREEVDKARALRRESRRRGGYKFDPPTAD